MQTIFLFACQFLGNYLAMRSILVQCRRVDSKKPLSIYRLQLTGALAAMCWLLPVRKSLSASPSSDPPTPAPLAGITHGGTALAPANVAPTPGVRTLTPSLPLEARRALTRIYLGQAVAEAKRMAEPEATDCLSEIAPVYARIGDVPTALAIVRGFKYDKATAADRSEATQKIALAQLHAGDLAGARTTISEVRPSIDRSYLMPDFVEAQARHGDFSAAFKTAKSLPAFVRGDALCRLAQAQANAGDFAAALRTAKRIPAPDSWQAFAGIAGAQTRAGNVDEAILQAKTMSDPTAQAKVMAEIARTLAQTGQVAQALPLAAGLGDDRAQDICRGEIATAQARAGDVSGALHTLSLMERPNLASTDGFYAVSQAQAENGDLQGAVQTAERIEDALVRGQTFGELAVVQARRGDVPGALTLAAQMEDVIQHPEAADRNTDALGMVKAMYAGNMGAIAGEQALAGDRAGAKQTITTLVPREDASTGYLGAAEEMIRDSIHRQDVD